MSVCPCCAERLTACRALATAAAPRLCLSSRRASGREDAAAGTSMQRAGFIPCRPLCRSRSTRVPSRLRMARHTQHPEHVGSTDARCILSLSICTGERALVGARAAFAQRGAFPWWRVPCSRLLWSSHTAACLPSTTLQPAPAWKHAQDFCLRPPASLCALPLTATNTRTPIARATSRGVLLP